MAEVLARRPALVLASGSPRRRELLGRLGIPFDIRVPDIDETPVDAEAATVYVERLARAKARAAVRPDDDDVVLVAADTTVDVDGEIVGKPADLGEAIAVLSRLSGRSHRVHTGVAVARGPRLVSAVTTSTVTFRPLTRSAIDAFVAEVDPLDKAGGYTLQGPGAALLDSLDGSASNVAGLPMAQTERLLAEVGVELTRWGPPR